MHRLKVSREWYDKFIDNRIQYQSTIDNSETFRYSIKGSFNSSKLNYEKVFQLLNAFIFSMRFLRIENIRLVWSKELEEYNLQFLNQLEDFQKWQNIILDKEFEIDSHYFPDVEDVTNIYYNYLLDVEGEEVLLYKGNIRDVGNFSLWKNPKDNSVNYTIDLEIRRAFFMADTVFNISLSNDLLNSNREMLAQSEELFRTFLKERH